MLLIEKDQLWQNYYNYDMIINRALKNLSKKHFSWTQQSSNTVRIVLSDPLLHSGKNSNFSHITLR